MMGYGSGYGWYSGMWLFHLLIPLTVLLVFWWIVQSANSAHGETASEVLRKRLARGEITEREYKKLKREIER